MADEYVKAALYGISNFNRKAKEKIGMEKLIELLNEYEGQDTWGYDEEMGMPYYGWGDDCDYEAYLISKKYGFIQWLVENEKLKWTNKMEMRKIMLGMPEKQDYYIMMLAVTPQPIEFLISLLK